MMSMVDLIEKLGSEPKIIKGQKFFDDRGKMVFNNDFNFSDYGIKRFYTIRHNQFGFVRAYHGHKIESKFCICNDGVFRIVLFPLESYSRIENQIVGKNAKTYILNCEDGDILYVPNGYYNGFQNLSEVGTITFYSTTTLYESKNDDFRLPIEVAVNFGDFENKNIWDIKNYR